MFNCDPKPGKCGHSDKPSYTHTPKLTGHFGLPAVIAGCGGKQKRLYLRPLIFPKSLTTFCRFCTKCDGLCFVRAFHVFGPLRFPFCKTAFFCRACACTCVCTSLYLAKMLQHFWRNDKFLFTPSFSMNKREFSSICPLFKSEIRWGIQIFYQKLFCSSRMRVWKIAKIDKRKTMISIPRDA